MAANMLMTLIIMIMISDFDKVISISQTNIVGCCCPLVPMDLDVRMKAVLLGALFLIVSKLTDLHCNSLKLHKIAVCCNLFAKNAKDSVHYFMCQYISF